VSITAAAIDSTGDSRDRVHFASIKALVLDLDGTLYHNAPVRRAMALRLAAALARHPTVGWRTMRLISAYREAQEVLRDRAAGVGRGEQLASACTQAGVDPSWATGIVAHWMEQRPLDLVRRHMRPGVAEFLSAARRRGLSLGLFSDYPAEAKLDAMGIRHFFEAVRWAQEPDVAAFKPNPRGLQLTIDRLGVAPEDALHIGDRPRVDAEAARRAGMPAVIIGHRPPDPRQVKEPAPPASCVHVQTFGELAALLRLT
jgi:HAD superfamily hydrolase (TIGR01509 family)